MVLTLELPDSIAQALSVSGCADLSRKALEALAIEGFCEKKLSQHQVGQLLGRSEINALLPSTIPTGQQQLTVTSSGLTTAAYTVAVNALEPGILAPPSFNLRGVQYAVGIFSDGAYALPSGAISGVNSRPAKPGDVITLYGVGFGPVTPFSPAGVLVQGLTSMASTFQVSIGGAAASVSFAGLAPGFTGLYQFNVIVPAVPPGNQPFTFTLGGGTGAQSLSLPIGN